MIKISLPDDNITFKRWELVNNRYEIETKARNKGVYVLRDENGTVLYVGKSIRLYKRLTDHVSGRGPSSEFNQLIDSITVYFVTESYEVDIYESYAINLFKPQFNKDKVFYRKVDDILQIKYDEVCELIDSITCERDELKEERRNLTPTLDMDETIVDDSDNQIYLLGEFLLLSSRIESLDEKLIKLRDKKKQLSVLLDD